MMKEVMVGSLSDIPQYPVYEIEGRNGEASIKQSILMEFGLVYLAALDIIWQEKYIAFYNCLYHSIVIPCNTWRYRLPDYKC